MGWTATRVFYGAEPANGAWRYHPAKQLRICSTRRSNDADSGKDATILVILARVQFRNGKKEKAVETQKKAVELADADTREKFQEFLDGYKAGKLPKLD